MPMRLPFPVWAVLLLVLLVCAALLQSGAMTVADVQALLGNLFAGVATLLVILMGVAAGPVILLGAVMVMHDRTKAIELVSAGLIFGMVAGAWHFGVWDWLQAHGGTITSHLFARR